MSGSQSLTVTTWAGGVLGFSAFAIVANCLGYIFIYGSKPGKEAGQDAFIHNVCTPGKGLLPTLLTTGYVKAAWRRFTVGWSSYFAGRFDLAKVGSKAPDAKLVSLDGKPLSLLSDFVQRTAKGVPLIINLGSYT